MEHKQKRDFSDFKLKIQRAPTTDLSYKKYGGYSSYYVKSRAYSIDQDTVLGLAGYIKIAYYICQDSY